MAASSSYSLGSVIWSVSLLTSVLCGLSFGVILFGHENAVMYAFMVEMQLLFMALMVLLLFLDGLLRAALACFVNYKFRCLELSHKASTLVCSNDRSVLCFAIDRLLASGADKPETAVRDATSEVATQDFGEEKVESDAVPDTPDLCDDKRVVNDDEASSGDTRVTSL